METCSRPPCDAMPRSKSSRAWLARHARDPYVKRAREEGARSRAHFKLAEIDRRDKLFRPGMCVVDLGAAPGGWSAYAATRVAPGGRVIAVDLLPIAPIVDVETIKGNIADPQVLDFLKNKLAGAADLVISDLAPNITGIASRDQARSAEMAERTIDLAEETLVTGGVLLLKAFHGAGFEALLQRLRRLFARVAIRKPGASRAESREIYLVAKGFRG
jgi:23S rRNA (uridine2552-2'-O)-methyltransferase